MSGSINGEPTASAVTRTLPGLTLAITLAILTAIRGAVQDEVLC